MRFPFATALAALLLAACDRAPTGPGPLARDLAVGDALSLNAQFGEGLLCSGARASARAGRVAAVSARAVVVHDVENPAGGYSDGEYRALAAVFDTLVWPVVTEAFGEPADLDRNGRVILFFTRAVNEITPAGQPWHVGGIFASRDLFPVRRTARLAGCAGSNEGEILYLLVPDPAGEVNGNVRTRAQHLHRAHATIAHELQHLVNASARLHGAAPVPADWAEEPWLNEGLSQVAEELVGFRATGLGPGRRIDRSTLAEAPLPVAGLFSTYLQENLQNLGHYLQRPDTASLHGPDGLATRGAAWAFLRYAADRQGGGSPAFWRAMVRPGAAGAASLGGALGSGVEDHVHDWLAALAADVPGAAAAERFRYGSWELASVYPRLRDPSGAAYGAYPLAVARLGAGAAEGSATVRAGSAAYFAFGAAPGGEVEARTGAAGGCGAVRTLARGEALVLPLAHAAALCLSGGASGAEFVYVVSSTESGGGRAVTLSLRGALVPPPPAALRAEAAPAVDRAAAWEHGFRRAERAELASGATPAAVKWPPPASALGPLRVTVVRVR